MPDYGHQPLHQDASTFILPLIAEDAIRIMDSTLCWRHTAEPAQRVGCSSGKEKHPDQSVTPH